MFEMSRIVLESSKRDTLQPTEAYDVTLQLQTRLEQVLARGKANSLSSDDPFGRAVLSGKHCILRRLHLRYYVPGWLEPERYGQSRDLCAQAALDLVHLLLHWSDTHGCLASARALAASSSSNAAQAPLSTDTMMAHDDYLLRLHLASGAWLGRQAALSGLLLQHHVYMLERYVGTASTAPALADQLDRVRTAISQMQELMRVAAPLWQVDPNVVENLLKPTPPTDTSAAGTPTAPTSTWRAPSAPSTSPSSSSTAVPASTRQPVAPVPTAPPPSLANLLLPVSLPPVTSTTSTSSFEADAAQVMDQPWFEQFEQAGSLFEQVPNDFAFGTLDPLPVLPDSSINPPLFPAEPSAWTWPAAPKDV